MRKILIAALLATGFLAAAPVSASEAPKAPSAHWSFDGPFGSFDRAAIRRGYIVYKNVCAACHSMHLVAFRHLKGVGFSDDEIKALAAQIEVQDGPNDKGEMFSRPGRPADRFKSPFPNDQAARAANGGALPPDLSLMVKARKGGADYLHGILIGYTPAPKDVKVPDGMYYNAYFGGHQIAMPPPLSEGAVEFPDGTKATVAQMAHDVTTFLAWTAEPEMEERKSMGIRVLLFLLVLTGLLYAVKRSVWADVH